MSTATVHPHHTRASQSDLMALARYWEWERTVEHELPRVIAETDIRIMFQPIFRLVAGMPILRGFEALSRFPAPSIPPGLWFRTAREMGLCRDLEIISIRAAIDSLQRSSEKAFLCVKASLDTMPDLVEIIPKTLGGRLIIEVHHSAFDRLPSEVPSPQLRDRGVRLAVDNVPLEDAYHFRPILLDLQPDFIKVDVLNGLVESPMSRLELAECAYWCEEVGIGLIAERVESLEDLEILDKIGVKWAQGFSLSPPMSL